MAPISSEHALEISGADSERLEKIRINFLFDHPFLSVLALSIPTEYRKNRSELFETNGYKLFIDSGKLSLYSDETLKYQFAHTLLHILLKHPFRMKDRDSKLWNRSCDIAINLLLEQFERVGSRPEDEVLLKKFDDMSVEAIYAALYEESEDAEGEEESDEKKEDKRDLIEEEGDTKEYEADIDAFIIQAVTAAKKAGTIPSSLVELITDMTKPKIDLQTLLNAYMSESFYNKEPHFSKPNRRFIHQGLYLPGYVQEKNRLVVSIALDRSMSISKEVFEHFLGMIDAVLKMSGDYMITIIPFDEQVYRDEVSVYDGEVPHDPIALSKGNGGTDFSCVVEYMERHNHNWERQFLIVLSDGFFTIKKMVEMPTLFLISEFNNVERLKSYGDVIRFDL